MGADGGVVYLKLRKGTSGRYARVNELLKPFWNFLSSSGRCHEAERSTSSWHKKNPEITPPLFLVGYWGTDRGDSLSLHDLREICTWDQDEIYQLSFDDLDLECRTLSPPLLGRAFGSHPLHALWVEHFRYTSREETLSKLGPLKTVIISDWVKELEELLDFKSFTHEQTWS